MVKRQRGGRLGQARPEEGRHSSRSTHFGRASVTSLGQTDPGTVLGVCHSVTSGLGRGVTVTPHPDV
jgi:hypothetical protein